MLVVALTGCRGILGLDTPALGVDAAGADSGDAPRADAAIDVAPGYVSVSFQQGVSGYGDGHDTYIDSGSPNATRGMDSRLRYRVGARWALIWFDGIFATGQVPAGATIQTAQLTVEVDQANCAADLVETTVPWDETVTYNTFGPSPGVDTADLGATVATVAQMQGAQTLNVTASVSAWSADPATNHGWILVPGAGADSQISSNEDGVPSSRPHLVVVFKQ